MMTELKKLNDIYNLWMTSGIFSTLNNYDVPWKDDTDTISLNLQYHGNHSGEKIASPLLYKMTQGLPITTEVNEKIAGVIYNLFSMNWKKLWDTLSFEYNPIENYRMVESGDDTTDNTYSRTQNDNITLNTTTDNTTVIKDTGTLTEAGTEGGTVNHTGTNTGTITTSKNSDTTNHKTVTDTGTVQRASSDTGTIDTTNTGTVSDVGSRTGEVTSDSTLNIYGFNSRPPGQPMNDTTGTNNTTENTTNTKTNDLKGKETRNLSGSNDETRNLSTDDLTTEKIIGSDKETQDLKNSNSETRDLNSSNTTTRDLTSNTTNNQTTNNTHTGKTDIADIGNTKTKHNLTRSGNIGVTTSQQMIESERKLWKYNFFCDTVFPDIDKILTIQIY